MGVILSGEAAIERELLLEVLIMKNCINFVQVILYLFKREEMPRVPVWIIVILFHAG
jgi:hypothetical protein